MTLKKKLSDLYIQGKQVEVGEGDEKVAVFIRKLLPLEAESAYRAAQAAKSVAMAARMDIASPLFGVVNARAGDATREEMVIFLGVLDMQKRRAVVEAEVESDEKWSKEGFLQGLYDRWEGGLKEAFFDEKHTDHEDAQSVRKALDEYDAALQARLTREEERVRKDLEGVDTQKLRDRYMDALFEQHSDVAWMREYQRQQLLFALRDPEDHSQQIFDEAAEIANLAPELLAKLNEELANISVDVASGKG